MTRRHKVWLVVAVLFVAANLGGAGVALVEGEAFHALTHIALLFPGAYLVSRFASRRASRRVEGFVESDLIAEDTDFTDRLTRLEHSLDAVAIEMERIGEGQRFMTTRMTEVRADRR